MSSPSEFPTIDPPSATQNDEGAASVIVSSFQFCDCQSPEFPPNHLEIHTHAVLLQCGNAVAVSYAIGDFGREKHLIGHAVNDRGQSYTLELGGEWDLYGMMTLLSNLSQEKSAIWIDQFSIPQEDEEIRKQLQRVPEIYGTFEVIVMLPNEPCECLRDSYDRWRSGDDFFKTSDGSFYADRVFIGCTYSVAPSSYSFRVWTGQEFGYARLISARYCSGTEAKCVKALTGWDDDISLMVQRKDYLNKYIQWLYDDCHVTASAYADIDDGGMAWALTRAHCYKVCFGLADNIFSFYSHGHDFRAGRSPFQFTAEFLLGKQFQRKQTNIHEVAVLSIVGGTQRATFEADYVLAVFPGLTRYEVPFNWTTLSPCDLFQDALSQYQFHTGKHQNSRLPQGLFEFVSGSSRYRPSHCLSTAKVKNYRTLYGVFDGSESHEVNSVGSVMIHLLDHQQSSSYTPRLMRSQTFKAAFGKSSIDDALQFMRMVFQGNTGSRARDPLFNYLAQRTVAQGSTAPVQWKHPDLGLETFNELIFLDRGWKDLPEIDHYEACYRLMCNWASIDVVIAKQKGLGLVVSIDEPPCIGFLNPELYRLMEQLDKFRSLSPAQEVYPKASVEEVRRMYNTFSKGCLSAQMNTYAGGGPGKELVYEIFNGNGIRVKVSKPGWIHDPDDGREQRYFPGYMVMGVWFPTFSDDPSIGARYTRTWAERDVFIL